jgi:hypothetical protein
MLTCLQISLCTCEPDLTGLISAGPGSECMASNQNNSYRIYDGDVTVRHVSSSSLFSAYIHSSKRQNVGRNFKRLEIWVFRYIIINILHKGDNE